MPSAMQVFANGFPIRHWLVILRDIMLKGASIADFWPHLLAIAALGASLISVAVPVLTDQDRVGTILVVACVSRGRP
jgi:hypothetical protein